MGIYSANRERARERVPLLTTQKLLRSVSVKSSSCQWCGGMGFAEDARDAAASLLTAPHEVLRQRRHCSSQKSRIFPGLFIDKDCSVIRNTFETRLFPEDSPWSVNLLWVATFFPPLRPYKFLLRSLEVMWSPDPIALPRASPSFPGSSHCMLIPYHQIPNHRSLGPEDVMPGLLSLWHYFCCNCDSCQYSQKLVTFPNPNIRLIARSSLTLFFFSLLNYFWNSFHFNQKIPVIEIPLQA